MVKDTNPLLQDEFTMENKCINDVYNYDSVDLKIAEGRS